METRVRTRPRKSSGSVDYYDWDPNRFLYSVDNPNTHTATPVTDHTDHSEYFQDVFDPEYLDKKKRGELILHPCVQWKRKLQCSNTTLFIGDGSFESVQPIPNWGVAKYTGPLLANRLPNYFDPAVRPFGYDDWVEHAKSLTLQKAIGKAKTSTILSGETLGTLQQTLGMLRRPLSASLDLLAKIAKKKSSFMKAGVDGLTAGASAWLEYRYGWSPLIKDIKALVAEIHKRREILLNGRLVCRDSTKNERSSETSQKVALNGRYYLFDSNSTHTCVAQVRSAVYYYLKPMDGGEYTRRFLGLRARDIPGTLYELTPWSFVVDWFFALGAWLEYVIPDPYVEIEGSVTSLKEYFYTNHRVTGSILVKGKERPLLYDVRPEVWDEYWRYERVINPHLAMQLPSSDGPSLSALQSVDAFALTLAAIAKKVPAMVSR